ncbi:MAG: SEC-C metal-binding domain-containing protein, partial [Acidobacteria bacterium]|nr:SEC-C metal-binding domain-containing protein [Acidobacteriota bacterium]
KLAGMTGTADTEALEFDKIYKLDVVVIPPNRPLRRTEFPDVVYRTMEEKFRAVIEEICELYEKGQPVLVGTITIENSERISRLLKLKKIPHVVLNAKYHEKEAEIVARAGQKGVVTIATNMAGRGTDIVLGEGVKPLGGLHILGTERHEARRIDNQLRGRAGRQGDPGSSRFYMSLEDDLMRIFGSDRISGIMQRLGMEEDVPIVHSMVTKSIERAQRQVEAHNFEIRKHLLDYDDVMNKQRNEIYRLRRELLDGKGQREYIFEKTEDVVDWLMETHAADDQDPGDWQLETMWQELFRYFGVDLRRLSSAVHDDGMGRTALRDEIWKAVREKYEEKENRYGTEKMRQQERLILLHVIDTEWKDHLLSMDHLREGIGLRGYGQRDPLVEYKREGFTMFGSMKERIEDNLLRFLFNLEMGTEQRRRDEEIQKRREQRLIYGAQAGADKASARQPKRRDAPKVGRNEPCPCGSGKKYKKCHGG